jgi:hypothetical protein
MTVTIPATEIFFFVERFTRDRLRCTMGASMGKRTQGAQETRRISEASSARQRLIDTRFGGFSFAEGIVDESVEMRLEKLRRSERYRSDFEMVRHQLSKIAAWAKPGKRKPLKGILFRDDKGRIVSGDEMREILEKGNANRRRILANDVVFEKYGLRLYFDPDRSHPKGFDPFKDPYVRMSVPLDRPAKEILEKIRSVRKPKKTRPRRTYSEDEIRLASNLMRKGSSPLEIFRRIRPEFAGFHPRRDYYDKSSKTKNDREGLKEDYRTLGDFKAHDEYQRCLRLIRKLRKPSR